MGRLFLREFDQPSPDYLMCKCCQTPIALPGDFYCNSPSEQPGVYDLVFQDRGRRIINVIVDRAVHHRQVGANIVADLYCVKCCDKLGFKYIESATGQQPFLREGMVQFRKDKVQRRNGDRIINGEEGEAIQYHIV